MMLRLFLVILFALVSAAQSHAEDRLALLIGNSRYEHATPLLNPENDVGLVAESLKRAGFSVRAESNLPLSAMKQAIDAFVAEAVAKPGAVVVLFYAGHGVQIDGENYILPVDLKVDRDLLAAGAVRVDGILKALEAAGSRVQIVILDACRDDPFPEKARGLNSGLKPEESKQQGRLIAFSTAPGKTALDGNSGNSPYSSALAESILVPGLRLEEVFGRTRAKVKERTKNLQEPWETAALSAEPFHFVPPQEDAASKVTDGEELLWDYASIVATAEGFQRYLDKYPEGRFATLAKLRIEAFNKDQSFFRRNETFPIITADFDEVSFCRGKTLSNGTVNGDIQGFRSVAALKDQVAYVDIEVPLKEFVCTKDSVADLQWIPPEGQSCKDFEARILPIELPRNLAKRRCWQGESSGDPESDQQMKQVSVDGGGVEFSGGEGTTVRLPMMNKKFWFTDIRLAEGSFEDAVINFRGFARIYEGAAEEFQFIEFQPFDPREHGLTGRAENTKLRFAAGERMDADDVVKVNLTPTERKNRSAAPPVGPITSYWMHNGSVVGLVKDEELRKFVYVAPRKGIGDAGAAADTVLFEGSASDNGRTYSGNAYTFRKGCSSTAYWVEGQVSQDDRRIVLKGMAAKFDAKCWPVGEKSDTLVFERLGLTRDSSVEAAIADVR